VRLSGGTALRAALVGILGGVAVVTRSPLLMAIPPIVLIVAWSWWRRLRRAAAVPLAVFASCLLATIGLATVRNVVVSGQFVLISSAGPINLFVGNFPPPEVDVSGADTREIYRRLRLDPLVAKVVEYAVRAPRVFAVGLLRKAEFVLGLSAPGTEERFFVFTWLTALIGIGLALRTPALRDEPLALAPAIIALCHFAVTVIVGNLTYRYRLVYPLYLMLLPYSALALTRAGSRLLGRTAMNS